MRWLFDGSVDVSDVDAWIVPWPRRYIPQIPNTPSRSISGFRIATGIRMLAIFTAQLSLACG